ncbi:septum formation inhibitor Maf [Thiohalocapsa marina]|uniref:dTTP/UTP pyrophosphatase n=1 Tax=Thiohalocapsa marina TaxID=424902 RepID=A0A5M8FTY2_9GAMM|nr:nucleoside triphosphate pyrophosphatase [Thiohalocapsa marina]KAA6187268.1 septum formation inhibitor Maf [Thiohalocapsa marina]
MNEVALYLASRSPRRRELLQQLGLAHGLLPADVDESPLPGESAEAFVIRIALEKARAGRQVAPSPLPVLGADTAVVCDGRILGKPADAADAAAMLALLSGRAHRVLTGVAVLGQREQTVLSETRVQFRQIAPAEADAYWASGEPRDKAGAYAIQGRGALFVERISGSYTGVVGLPLFETARLLAAEGVHPWDSTLVPSNLGNQTP